MLVLTEQEVARQERLTEVGTMPPCPICLRPRVQRSDYIRCNPCGMNWLKGEDLSRDARVSRAPYTNRAIAMARSGSAQSAPEDDE